MWAVSTEAGLPAEQSGQLSWGPRPTGALKAQGCLCGNDFVVIWLIVHLFGNMHHWNAIKNWNGKCPEVNLWPCLIEGPCVKTQFQSQFNLFNILVIRLTWCIYFYTPILTNLPKANLGHGNTPVQEYWLVSGALGKMCLGKCVCVCGGAQLEPTVDFYFYSWLIRPCM